jgi:hypothetical protein
MLTCPRLRNGVIQTQGQFSKTDYEKVSSSVQNSVCKSAGICPAQYFFRNELDE